MHGHLNVRFSSSFVGLTSLKYSDSKVYGISSSAPFSCLVSLKTLINNVHIKSGTWNGICNRFGSRMHNN